jgi:hypothetical protein
VVAIARLQQLADGGQRQAGATVPADPGEPGRVGLAVAPVAGDRPGRRPQQAQPVVVEQGAAGQATAAGQLADAQLGAWSGWRSICPVVR